VSRRRPVSSCARAKAAMPGAKMLAVVELGAELEALAWALEIGEPRARLPVRPGGLFRRRLDGTLPVGY